MVRSLRKQKGFTLVEVIVVAVIVAALAAVAIGVYLNYVTSSRQNVVNNAAGALASFCGACVNSGGTPDATANPWTCDANTTTIQVPADMTASLSDGAVTVEHNADDAITTEVRFAPAVVP